MEKIDTTNDKLENLRLNLDVAGFHFQIVIMIYEGYVGAY